MQQWSAVTVVECCFFQDHNQEAKQPKVRQHSIKDGAGCKSNKKMMQQRACDFQTMENGGDSAKLLSRLKGRETTNEDGDNISKKQCSVVHK
jgi:hypothetical protein